jgi:hypothetical protein
MFREDANKILLIVVFIITTTYLAIQDLHFFYTPF